MKTFNPKLLTMRQEARFTTICKVCGFEPDYDNWLEMCTTVLFAKICGYNAQKMSDMMYPHMLGTRHLIDYLYKEFKEKGLTNL